MAKGEFAPRVLIPVPIFSEQDPKQQIAALVEEIRRMAEDVNRNITVGLVTFRVTTSKPTLEEVDEGQLVLGKEGATWSIYTNIDGTLYKVALTAA